MSQRKSHTAAGAMLVTVCGNRHVSGTYQLKGDEGIKGRRVARKRNESELERFRGTSLAFMLRAMRRALMELEEDRNVTLTPATQIEGKAPGASVTISFLETLSSNLERSERQDPVLWACKSETEWSCCRDNAENSITFKGLPTLARRR